jgi:hypothetical protein
MNILLPIPAFNWINIEITPINTIYLFYFTIAILNYICYWYWNKTRYKDKDYRWWFGIMLSSFWIFMIPLFIDSLFESISGKPKRKRD